MWISSLHMTLNDLGPYRTFGITFFIIFGHMPIYKNLMACVVIALLDAFGLFKITAAVPTPMFLAQNPHICKLPQR
jgi:hypothetical protein